MLKVLVLFECKSTPVVVGGERGGSVYCDVGRPNRYCDDGPVLDERLSMLSVGTIVRAFGVSIRYKKTRCPLLSWLGGRVVSPLPFLAMVMVQL